MKHSLLILSLFMTTVILGQPNPMDPLIQEINTITEKHKANIGIAIIQVETKAMLIHNNDGIPYPMQSVYKFPLALYVLHLVDEHKLSLSKTYRVTKKDMAPDTWSPLKEKFPNGNVDVTLSDLLYYSVSTSDNIACDVLFRIVKGPSQVTKYIHQLGFNEITLLSTEHQMHLDPSLQFKNTSTPLAMSQLLQAFYKKELLPDSLNNLLMNWMTESPTSAMRIKGLLPPNTKVAHKTGTGGQDAKGLTSACNDVGIITMPNGTHLCLSVFVTNSTESHEMNERVIAEIAKVFYDYFNH